ncbi:MAG: hypothetical protein AABZ47_01080 [Planctomycetota bacterium]
MQRSTYDKNDVEQLLARIREGLVEGIRQEVERRRRLGIPLYIDRDGQVVAVMADGSPACSDTTTESARLVPEQA